MSFLETVTSPAVLRTLSLPQLEILAAEIREKLVETVSQTGGHLAPNLGVVELTIALHRIFDTPRDQIVWDVGHQTYVHKLLTGRQENFATLRTFGGLSGFPKREESIYDCFNTGHSSTSISAALGLALARDLKGENYAVVAVIGDGALTAGMAFEALNHAGHLKTSLIVVLNDNEMSISQNVGALARYLGRLRTDPRYSRRKKILESALQQVPPAGPRLLGWGKRIKDSLKYLVLPGMFFEGLGFTYLGPVDGNDLPRLEELLGRAKLVSGPTLVHVLTQKGKGYSPAEKDSEAFHGTGPFEIATGLPREKKPLPTYTEVFGKTICELAAENKKIVAITAAMKDGTGLKEFSTNYPQRFYDVGIAEQHAVTLAAGLAAGGYHPVVAIYSTFLQRAYDQVAHDVCLQKLPVVFALDRAGIVGEDGETHQGIFDFAYLRHLPGLVIMAPKDEEELRQMLVTAFAIDGPVALRYPRGEARGVPLNTELKRLPLGKGELLREGREITLLAIGPLVYEALTAAETLAREGITATVINARFLKPLDQELICTQVQKTKNFLTVEEHVRAGGFGSAVLELLAKEGITEVKAGCLAIPDVFVPHGKAAVLRSLYGLDAAGITAAARNLLGLRREVKLVRGRNY